MSLENSKLGNRYLLEKSIGSGGMAEVYRAQDLTLERTVAVKVLRADYSRDSAFRERFRQEAKAVANLSHPNVVTVHDFGIDAGRLFIVMEYVPGTNMEAVLQKRGRYTVDEALPLIRQVCAGVGYAHRAGLVHCDIKPHNFLITPDNRLKVADFGIARALAATYPPEKGSLVWGTPHYSAPEQTSGDAPTPASDVYSIGVVLYYMVSGRLPFSATTTEELAGLHRATLPTPPSQYNPAILPDLDQIILKVLSKEPSSRYRTADQLGRVLITFAKKYNYPSIEADQIATQAAIPFNATASETKDTFKPTFPPPAAVKPSKQPKPESTLPEQPAYNPLDIDWVALVLGLVALIAVGGLVPFWLWVYLTWNPPLR